MKFGAHSVEVCVDQCCGRPAPAPNEALSLEEASTFLMSARLILASTLLALSSRAASDDAVPEVPENPAENPYKGYTEKEECYAWAADGQCKLNPAFMLSSCKYSCFEWYEFRRKQASSCGRGRVWSGRAVGRVSRAWHRARARRLVLGRPSLGSQQYLTRRARSDHSTPTQASTSTSGATSGPRAASAGGTNPSCSRPARRHARTGGTSRRRRRWRRRAASARRERRPGGREGRRRVEGRRRARRKLKTRCDAGVSVLFSLAQGPTVGEHTSVAAMHGGRGRGGAWCRPWRCCLLRALACCMWPAATAIGRFRPSCAWCSIRATNFSSWCGRIP